MYSSTLNRPTEGHHASGIDAQTDPYAGTWLAGYGPELRAELLEEHDKLIEVLDRAETPKSETPLRVPAGETSWGMDTYPASLQEDIRKSLHDDDAMYPTLPSEEEQRRTDEETAARLRAYLGSMNRNR